MRPVLIFALVLLCCPAAEARVVVVATGGSQAALIDTRTNAVVGQVPVPGSARAVAAAPEPST